MFVDLKELEFGIFKLKFISKAKIDFNWEIWK